MARWLILPHVDVILMPRDWSFRFHSRGLIFGVTGMFDPDGSGRVTKTKGRIGLPLA